jgi:hypothetical protein
MDDNHETSPFDLTQAVAPKPIVAQFKQLCRLITSGSHTKDAKVIPMNTWKYALLAIFIILFVLFLLLFISKGN